MKKKCNAKKIQEEVREILFKLCKGIESFSPVHLLLSLNGAFSEHKFISKNSKKSSFSFLCTPILLPVQNRLFNEYFLMRNEEKKKHSCYFPFILIFIFMFFWLLSLTLVLSFSWCVYLLTPILGEINVTPIWISSYSQIRNEKFPFTKVK